MSRNKRNNLISNILKHFPGFPQCYFFFFAIFFNTLRLKCLSPKKEKEKENDQGPLFIEVQETS